MSQLRIYVDGKPHWQPEGPARVGDNVVDVTVGFLASMPRPPRELTDAEINGTLASHISVVVAAIQSVLTSMGFAALGTIDEPMSEHSSPTGEFGTSTPIHVTLEMVDVDEPVGPVQ